MRSPVTASSTRNTQACGHQMVPAGTNSSPAMTASQIKVLITRFASIRHSAALRKPYLRKGSQDMLKAINRIDLITVEDRPNPASQLLIGERLADHLQPRIEPA